MEEFIKFINERIDKGLMPGVLAGIYDKNDTPLFEHVYGYSDVEKKVQIKKDNIFRLASMTKPITGVACMYCYEKGLLDINDKVSKYLPEFAEMFVGKMVDGKPQKDFKCKNEMRIVDILTHSSGIGSLDVGMYFLTHNGKFKNLDEQIKRYSSWLLDFEPGTATAYSALTGLDIVVKIIEIVTKTNYYDFLKKNILLPLDMVDTTYKLNDEQKKRLVTMYTLNQDGTEMSLDTSFKDYTGFDCMEEGYTSGCAGLFSTLHDYRNFSNMLLNEGKFNGKQILKKETVDLMKTPFLDPNTVKYCDRNLIWGPSAMLITTHTCDFSFVEDGSYGWSGAYSTHFFVDPKDEIVGVLMINLNMYGGSGAPSAKEFEKATTKFVKK